MDIRPIHTEADYKAALKIASGLVDLDPESGTAEGDRLDVLATLIEVYESEHFPIALPDPVDAIKNSEEDIAAYLTTALEENDAALLAAALGDIARSRGMTQVAKDSGITREALYKALRPDSNPRFHYHIN